MSTNDELIADVKEHLAHNVWDDEIFVLAEQLVTALEKVTAEHDSVSTLLEQTNLRLRYAEGERRLAEQERDRLAAFREDVQAADNEHAHDEDGYSYFRHDVQDALKAAPSVALDRVKAEALRRVANDYAESGREQSFGVTSVLTFLYARADRIEKGESNGQ